MELVIVSHEFFIIEIRAVSRSLYQSARSDGGGEFRKEALAYDRAHVREVFHSLVESAEANVERKLLGFGGVFKNAHDNLVKKQGSAFYYIQMSEGDGVVGSRRDSYALIRFHRLF
jgi:hypothetical protein